MIQTNPPKLRFVFTITAQVPEVSDFIPLEDRAGEKLEFIPITGGSVEGEISGDIIPGGGDWCLTRSDEAYNVEARYLFRTPEGEVVDVVNVGVLRNLTDSDNTQVDMGYFLTTPRFRTTSTRLQWLTRSVFVGRAQSHPSKTVIDVYEVLQ